MLQNLLYVGAALLLVLLNGFFVAAEFALVKLRQTQATTLAASRGWRGRLLGDVHGHLDAYLSACQLGITLASLGLGWIGEPAFARLLEPLFARFGVGAETTQVVALVLAFTLISYLHIVLGELAPKSMAIRRPERFSLLTAAPLYAFYWLMQLVVAPAAEREQAPLAPVPQARLLAVEDREQAREAIATLLVDAKYELAIYTRDLDPFLLDTTAALEAIKRVALSGRRAQVRIIVQDPRKAVADGHRLIALAQRLPSVIAIRTPVDEQDLQYAAAFLLNDRRGYLFRPLGNRPDGEGSTYAPGRHAQLAALFDQVWERSAPSEELRLLSF